MTPKRLAATLTAGALVLAGLTASTATAATATQSETQTGHRAPRPPAKHATAIGFGGAVAVRRPRRHQHRPVGVLRRGGNAVDAAVATAAALGVTEPYSAGIGGGGYFVYYSAKNRKVYTIDGRETAPATMPDDAFINPATGKPYTFTPDLVTSGVSVGVPGTLATWDSALASWGTLSLGKALKPAAQLADRGFVVDQTFRSQTLDNKTRFSAITPTAKLFLPNGDAPVVGSVFQNKELAKTYELIAKRGPSAFYTGPLAQEMESVVKAPPKVPGTTLPVPPGYLTTADLAKYKVLRQDPTKVRYDGLDVYGMAPSSSGGTTVGEALNILTPQKLSQKTTPQALHSYLEASALSFADRGAYVGDPAFVNVPTKELLSKGFGAERSCLIDPDQGGGQAGAGRLAGRFVLRVRAGRRDRGEARHGRRVDHPPGRRGQVGQRRLVHADDRADRRQRHHRSGPWFPAEQRADRLLDRVRRGRPEPDPARQAAALVDVADDRAEERQAVPRARFTGWLDDHHDRPADADQPAGPGDDAAGGRRRTARVTAQHAERHRRTGVHRCARRPLKPLGHTLVKAGDAFTSAAEIGAVAALEVLPGGGYLAAAEPVRRGGGAAGTVHQLWPR